MISPANKDLKSFCLKRNDGQFFGGFEPSNAANWVDEQAAILMTVDQAEAQATLLNCFVKRIKKAGQ